MHGNDECEWRGRNEVFDYRVRCEGLSASLDAFARESLERGSAHGNDIGKNETQSTKLRRLQESPFNKTLFYCGFGNAQVLLRIAVLAQNFQPPTSACLW